MDSFSQFLDGKTEKKTGFSQFIPFWTGKKGLDGKNPTLPEPLALFISSNSNDIGFSIDFIIIVTKIVHIFVDLSDSCICVHCYSLNCAPNLAGRSMLPTESAQFQLILALEIITF